MKFKIEIDCDNAAFGTSLDDRNLQVAEILRGVRNALRNEGGFTMRVFPLFDSNGNRVGSASYWPDRPQAYAEG